jgi:hypothetical protein
MAGIGGLLALLLLPGSGLPLLLMFGLEVLLVLVLGVLVGGWGGLRSSACAAHWLSSCMASTAVSLRRLPVRCVLVTSISLQLAQTVAGHTNSSSRAESESAMSKRGCTARSMGFCSNMRSTDQKGRMPIQSSWATSRHNNLLNAHGPSPGKSSSKGL